MATKAAICLLLQGAIAFQSQSQDESIQVALQSFHALADDIQPSDLADSPQMKFIVMSHTSGIRLLRRELVKNPSWKVRLAAAYALREMGFSHALVEGASDKHPLVRNYSRSAAKADGVVWRSEVAGREVESKYKEAVEDICSHRVKWTKGETKARIAVALPDLLRNETQPLLPGTADVAKRAALLIASSDPLITCELLLASASGGDKGLKHYLNAFTDLAMHCDSSKIQVIFDSCESFVYTALGEADSSTRMSAYRLGLQIFPASERLELIQKGLLELDESIRMSLVSATLSFAGTLEREGRAKEADALLNHLSTAFEGLSGSSAIEKILEAIKVKRAEIERERILLSQGALLEDRVQRYLRVGGNLIEVSEDEYALALSLHGKPLLTGDEWTALRDRQKGTIRDGNRPADVSPESGDIASKGNSAIQDSETNDDVARDSGFGSATLLGIVMLLLLAGVVASYLVVRSRNIG